MLQKCGLIAPDQNAKQPMFQLFSNVGISYKVLEVSDFCSLFIRAEWPVLAMTETQHVVAALPCLGLLHRPEQRLEVG